MAAPAKEVEAPKLTEKDLRFLVCAWQSVQGGEPRIDYLRLAAAAGMPTSNAATCAWWRLKKKLGLSFGDASTASASGTPAKGAGGAKSKKRKAAAPPVKAETDGDEGGGEPGECVANESKANKKARRGKDEASTDEACCKYEEESV